MRYIDRGNPLSGLLTTPRDVRLPSEAIRSGANFSLPDRRISRRRGFKPFTGSRIEGQQITRQAPNEYAQVDKDTIQAAFGKLAVTPNGYGLIRWEDDFQPKTTRNWTLEFLLTLGELDDISGTRSRRRTNQLFSGSRMLCRANDYGHIVFDQSVIVDYCNIYANGAAQNLRPPTTTGVPTSNLHDNVVIPAISVSYTEDDIRVVLGWYDVTNTRYDFHDTAKQLVYAWGAYPGAGSAVHVAITYQLSNRTVSLIIDGTVRDTYVVPSDFRIAGEVDAINSHTTAIQRDIVLMNECTVRHNYASTCKLTHAASACATISCTEEATTGSFGDIEPPGSLFHAAPGRGAGMCELRIWHTNRSTVDLSTYARKPLNGDEANLIGYWRLNDGGSIIKDLVGNRHGTLHNTYSPYIADAGFVRGSGLRFSDNNYLLGVIDARDPYDSDVGEVMRRVMLGSDEPKSLSKLNWVGSEAQAGNDITFQFQVRIPGAQQEIDRRTTGVPGGSMALAFQNETRERPGDPGFFSEVHPYRLKDGQHRSLCTYQGEIWTLAAPTKAVYHPAFDQTIFSIEARALIEDFFNIASVTAAGSPTRLTLNEEIPLTDYNTTDYYSVYVEGIQYAGTPAVDPNGNRLCKIISSGGGTTVIELYTSVGVLLDTTGGGAITRTAAFVRITPQGSRVFRNRERLVPLYRGLITPTNQLVFEFYGYGMWDTTGAGGWEHRTFYHRCTTTATYTAGDLLNVSMVKRTLFELSGGSYVRKGFVMEIYVNDALVQSMERIFTGTGANTNVAGVFHRPFTRCQTHEPRYYVSVGASYIGDGVDFNVQTPGGNASTWKLAYPEYTPQRSKSPRQDLVGFFSLGFFRVWSQALTPAQQLLTSNSVITDRTSDPTLLVNLEIDQITGDRIANKSRYAMLFDLSYKSWTVPQFVWSGTFAQRPSYGWSHEDCLGYGPRPSTFDSSTCGCGKGNLLAFFNATLTQTYGLLAIFEDSLLYNARLSGTLATVYVPECGLMNEFIPGQKWDATNIGDRSYLAAFGAIPKSFDGRAINYLGFPTYRGPRLSLGCANVSNGNVVSGKYYRVVLTYYSDELGIEQIGAEGVIHVNSPNNAIVIAGSSQFANQYSAIAQNPDGRITSIRFYRSRGMDSAALARSALVFAIGAGQATNRYILTFNSTETDAALGVVLDENYTRPPVCQYVAAWDGMLWMAGDPIFPDQIYRSFPGSPDLWDTITRVITLESGSGDIITGIVPLFGSMFVLKPGSIWRIDRLGADQYEPNRIFDIGAVAPRSISVVTIPDEGRTVIVFWSQHGPYMTDGNSLQSIGYPIEAINGGEPWDWLDPQTVFVSHDIQRRELHFHCKSKVGTTISDRHDIVVTYNYRFNAWSRSTGMFASCAASGTIANAGTGLVAELGPGEWSPLDFDSPAVYGAFVAGINGLIYTRAASVLDGINLGVSIHAKVSNFTSGVVTVSPSPGWTVNAYRGLWASFVHPKTKVVTSLPIASNTANTLTLSTGYTFYGSPVIPVDSEVYVAQTPLEIEFIWDVLDRPGIEKTVSQLLMWLVGTFEYRIALDWKNIPDVWKQIISDGSRILERPNALCEAIKLYVRSWSLNAQFSQYAFRTDEKEAPNRSEQ